MQHNSVNGTSNNLYATASTAGYMEPGKALQEAVKAWYGELAADGQSSLKLDNTNYNHFTQVVWAKTKEIGCGVANCPSLNGAAPNSFKWTYVVCDYSPAGNYLNQNIYTVSTAAGNKCPTGSTVNANKLCQINNVADIHA
ncbi:SCP domain-containing protein [Aphelenchoides bicaudatus]|nr:SCP domain-containing protein [Aphelenchoides bicaudatus]